MAPETLSPEPLEALLQPDPASQAMLNQVLVNTLGMAMHNAVNAQQNAQMQHAASAAAACVRILMARPRRAVPEEDPSAALV